MSSQTLTLTLTAADGATQQLTAPYPPLPTTSGPTFDVLGQAFTGTTGTSPMSLSITASAGADVFLYVSNAPATEYGPVRYGGSSGAFMTELGGATVGNNDSTLFRIAGAGTGSAAAVYFTPPHAASAAFVTFSIRDVTSVSTPVFEGASPEASWNFGSQACPSGDLLVGLIGMANAALTATLTGSGGNARYTSPGPAVAGVYLATNTVATNFGGSVAGNSAGWVGAVMTCS